MSTTPTHCPSCNSALGPFFCPVGYTAGGACSNPDCTDNTVHIGFSQPAQESQGESVAAPAEVGQVVDLCLADFEAWLESTYLYFLRHKRDTLSDSSYEKGMVGALVLAKQFRKLAAGVQP